MATREYMYACSLATMATGGAVLEEEARYGDARESEGAPVVLGGVEPHDGPARTSNCERMSAKREGPKSRWPKAVVAEGVAPRAAVGHVQRAEHGEELARDDFVTSALRRAGREVLLPVEAAGAKVYPSEDPGPCQPLPAVLH